MAQPSGPERDRLGGAKFVRPERMTSGTHSHCWCWIMGTNKEFKKSDFFSHEDSAKTGLDEVLL